MLQLLCTDSHFIQLCVSLSDLGN